MFPTKTEQLILKTLQAMGEMYGLEMIKVEPALKRGSVYVLLGRLEESKWVTSRLEEKKTSESGLPRRLYKISGLGLRALQAEEARLNVYAGNLAMGV